MVFRAAFDFFGMTPVGATRRVLAERIRKALQKTDSKRQTSVAIAPCLLLRNSNFAHEYRFAISNDREREAGSLFLAASELKLVFTQMNPEDLSTL